MIHLLLMSWIAWMGVGNVLADYTIGLNDSRTTYYPRDGWLDDPALSAENPACPHVFINPKFPRYQG
jgi:hypothetical protein